MTLYTTDYLEYYLTLVAWVVNNGIWSILVASGVFALPFVAIVIQEWLKARGEGADEGNKGVLSSMRIENRVWVAQGKTYSENPSCRMRRRRWNGGVWITCQRVCSNWSDPNSITLCRGSRMRCGLIGPGIKHPVHRRSRLSGRRFPPLRHEFAG